MNKLKKNEADTSSEPEEEEEKEEKYIMDDDTAIRLLEETDLKQPIHLNELRLSTFENDVFVDAEPESINFASFHFDKQTIK